MKVTPILLNQGSAPPAPSSHPGRSEPNLVECRASACTPLVCPLQPPTSTVTRMAFTTCPGHAMAQDGKPRMLIAGQQHIPFTGTPVSDHHPSQAWVLSGVSTNLTSRWDVAKGVKPGLR